MANMSMQDVFCEVSQCGLRVLILRFPKPLG